MKLVTTVFSRPDRLLTLVVVGWLAILGSVAIERPPWGDEQHYYATVLRFESGISADLLRTYEGELAPPLPFLTFAAWGQIAGFSLPALRVLSLLIALVTFITVHRLSLLVLGDEIQAALVTLFVVFHPYNIGLSVFVFNDMLATCFVTLAVLSALKRSAWLLGISLSLALLTRQYMAFALVATGLYFGWRWWTTRAPRELRCLCAVAVSALPLALLMLFWGGVGPDNLARAEYLAHRLTFKPSALMFYLAVTAVYLAPVLVIVRPGLSRPAVWAGAFTAVCYLWWPVVASDIQLAAGIPTSGFFHRVLKWASARSFPQLEHVVWCASAAIGAMVVVSVVAGRFRSVRHDDRLVLLSLLLICFLFVMPFSYMHWEKYYMPILPIAALAITSTRLRAPPAAMAGEGVNGSTALEENLV